VTRYDPWADLGERHPGVRVVHQDLDGEQGWCDVEGRTIVLERRLTQAERRCALAHEVAHLDRGDTCHGASYPDARRQEQRAEVAAHTEAARRLINVDDLARALTVYGEQALDLIADELWVDVDTLCARLDHLHPAERHYLRRRLNEKEDAA